MKRPIFAALGAGLLAMTLVSLDLLAVRNLDNILGRYPGSMRVVSERFNLLSVYKGYISQEGVYQTGDEVMNVWRWYAVQFNVEPEDGMNAEGRCVRLTKANYYILIRPTVVVMLCSTAHGTRVYVSQTVYLQR